jgi:D-sedoheptulose 7-phosphate isomerase
VNGAGTEGTSFLYPFLDASERGSERLLADLALSAAAKIADSTDLQRRTAERYAGPVRAAAAAMAQRFRAGGRLYTFGNGGSSTDATTVATLFARPPRGRALPGWCLSDDQAVITALGNDVGFDLVFARQLMACGRRSDIAMALSTSGCSEDLVVAMSEARRRGLLTIAFSGYDGGRLAASSDVDHCFTVDSQSVHRIQEAQADLAWRLWAGVQDVLDASSSVSPPIAVINGGS